VKVRVLMTVTSIGLNGPHPEGSITLEPKWVDKPA
jgi:hypothetical protein